MGVFSPSGPASPSTVNIQSKTTPDHSSTTVGLTETTLVIPVGTTAFAIRVKGNGKLLIGTSVGSTSTDDAWEIMPGFIFTEEFLSGSGAITYYIKSTKAATIVQLKTWS